MTEKNEAEDGNSISLKSPWHMKWDRQQFLPFFTCCLMSQKCKLCFLLYLKEIYAQFVEWGKKVLSPYTPQWSVYFSFSLLQIASKHPVPVAQVPHAVPAEDGHLRRLLRVILHDPRLHGLLARPAGEHSPLEVNTVYCNYDTGH